MEEILGIFAALDWAGLGNARNEDIVAVLLVCLVVTVGVSAIIMRRVAKAEMRARLRLQTPDRQRIPTAALFAPPTRWLAIRSQNVRLVQDALCVRNARTCAWSDALATSFEPRLFISPPVRGWIIVMGCDLPDPADDVDQCYLFLTQLSEKLGEIQFFNRNRAVSHHGWARLDAGKVQRAYMWAEETLWSQGAVSEAERELKFRCLAYSEPAEVLGLSSSEILSLNTDKVIRLAGQWSIDPTSVEADALDAQGIAGDLLHSKLH